MQARWGISVLLPLFFLFRQEVRSAALAVAAALAGYVVKAKDTRIPFALLLIHVITLQACPYLCAEQHAHAPEADLFPTPLSQVAVIITAREEPAEYVQRTVQSIIAHTPETVLGEIIVIDDASTDRVELAINNFGPKVRHVRNDERQGVARSRNLGARTAVSDVLVFLDAHCAPQDGWLAPLLRIIAGDREHRFAVPMLPPLDTDAWGIEGTEVPSKMMIDWSLKLEWFEDYTDDVPVLSGGVLAVARETWFSFGELDPQFEEWGGENLELSFRVWLCGGEIRLARESIIGHAYREELPYEVDARAVDRNYVRVVETWMDDYGAKVYSSGLPREHVDVEARLALRQRLKCNAFSSWVHRFNSILVLRKMVVPSVFEIRTANGRACLTAGDDSHLFAVPCKGLPEQRWTYVYGDHMRNVAFNTCIDAASAAYQRPLLYRCLERNRNQQWVQRASRIAWGHLCLTRGVDFELNATSGQGVFFHPCDYGPEGDVQQGYDVFILEQHEG
jgi:glycosyltransferase involved in cell wall biosynthesis